MIFFHQSLIGKSKINHFSFQFEFLTPLVHNFFLSMAIIVIFLKLCQAASLPNTLQWCSATSKKKKEKTMQTSSCVLKIVHVLAVARIHLYQFSSLFSWQPHESSFFSLNTNFIHFSVLCICYFLSFDTFSCLAPSYQVRYSSEKPFLTTLSKETKLKHWITFIESSYSIFHITHLCEIFIFVDYP